MKFKAQLSSTSIEFRIPSLTIEESFTASIEKELKIRSIEGFFPDLEDLKREYEKDRLAKLSKLPNYPALPPLEELLVSNEKVEEDKEIIEDEQNQETEMTPKDLRCMKEDILLAF